MAQFYALCDLGKIRHSYHWHNQRFYYNPITQKLEHIAFDCYAGIEEGIKKLSGYSKKINQITTVNIFQNKFLTTKNSLNIINII